jgi:hypothetical protein
MRVMWDILRGASKENHHGTFQHHEAGKTHHGLEPRLRSEHRGSKILPLKPQRHIH